MGNIKKGQLILLEDFLEELVSETETCWEDEKELGQHF